MKVHVPVLTLPKEVGEIIERLRDRPEDRSIGVGNVDARSFMRRPYMVAIFRWGTLGAGVRPLLPAVAGTRIFIGCTRVNTTKHPSKWTKIELQSSGGALPVRKLVRLKPSQDFIPQKARPMILPADPGAGIVADFEDLTAGTMWMQYWRLPVVDQAVANMGVVEQIDVP